MKPYPASIDLDKTALIIIDMQEDFIKPGGFGDKLGNDVSRLEKAVGPCRRVLEAARKHNLKLIIHTREGHRPDLTDLHPIKLQRPGAPASTVVIGCQGPKGRILVRGEPGHDIIPELYPKQGEPVIDKPGKGSFYATDLDAILHVRFEHAHRLNSSDDPP
jgi:nicotinamidase-related amidase